MKFTGTNKAIVKEANKFSKINFKKSFWHQNESIYRSQILPKLLNSKQLYCATKLPHVT